MRNNMFYETTFRLDPGHLLVIKVKLVKNLVANGEYIILDNMAILYLLKIYPKVRSILSSSTKNLVILTKTIDECLEHHEKSAEKRGFQSYGYIMNHMHNFNKLLHYRCVTILDVGDIKTDSKKTSKYDEGDAYIMKALQQYDIKYLFSHDPILKKLYAKKTIEEDKILDYL